MDSAAQVVYDPPVASKMHVVRKHDDPPSGGHVQGKAGPSKAAMEYGRFQDSWHGAPKPAKSKGKSAARTRVCSTMNLWL
jgi:hypothetical protein